MSEKIGGDVGGVVPSALVIPINQRLSVVRTPANIWALSFNDCTKITADVGVLITRRDDYKKRVKSGGKSWKFASFGPRVGFPPTASGSNETGVEKRSHSRLFAYCASQYIVMGRVRGVVVFTRNSL